MQTNSPLFKFSSVNLPIEMRFNLSVSIDNMSIVNINNYYPIMYTIANRRYELKTQDIDKYIRFVSDKQLFVNLVMDCDGACTYCYLPKLSDIRSLEFLNSLEASESDTSAQTSIEF